MARAAPFTPLLSQWLERMLPSARRGALSSAAHAAPLLGNALPVCMRMQLRHLLLLDCL